MKKTFFILALAAMAMPAMADEEIQPITLSNPAAGDFTWIAGENGLAGTGDANRITAAMGAGNVQGIINALPQGTDLVGWFGGTGQSHGNNHEINITGTDSFTFISRPRYTGEYVMMGVQLPGPAESVTLSFTADKYVGYALFAYDGTTVTEIMPKAVTNADQTSGATVTVTKNFEGADLKPSTLLVLWSNKPNNGSNISGGEVITVSNIQLSYIPEPATATLSLLALAGLAARRRRH
ncbi:MAG: hypothetical protein MJ051_06965 [Akkermansia sp.]|nr:hypothetical protein [Akkermansia sp.]